VYAIENSVNEGTYNLSKTCDLLRVFIILTVSPGSSSSLSDELYTIQSK